MVRYRLLGFSLACPFALPGFDACLDEAGDAPVDIVVDIGDPPPWNPEASWEKEGVAWGVRDGVFLLRYRDVGVMELRHGALIRASADVCRFPGLFGTMLANILVLTAAQQRGHLVLHCAAIAIGGRAVALTGPSGAGKSMLAFACWRRGHAVVTEDVGVLESAGAPALRPGIPYFRLRPDVLPSLGLDGWAWPRADGDRGKGIVGFPEAFARQSTPLGAIVRLDVAPAGSEEVRIEPLTGFDAIESLLMALPFAAVQHTPAMYRQFFDGCAALADAVPSYRLVRPRGLEYLDRTATHVEALFAAA